MQTNNQNTDEYLQRLPDWQAQNLRNFREFIHAASPDIHEEIKWGVPVFVYESKTLFSMASFKNHTKYNFIQNGGLLADPNGLFNNRLESKKSRSIDLQEDQSIAKEPLMDLIHEAIKLATT